MVWHIELDFMRPCDSRRTADIWSGEKISKKFSIPFQQNQTHASNCLINIWHAVGALQNCRWECSGCMKRHSGWCCFCPLLFDFLRLSLNNGQCARCQNQLSLTTLAHCHCTALLRMPIMHTHSLWIDVEMTSMERMRLRMSLFQAYLLADLSAAPHNAIDRE